MKKLFTLLLIFPFLTIQAQDPALDMSLLDNWAVDTLPASGSIKYNEVWGYTDCQGREFAIVGSAAYVHFLDVSDPQQVKELASFEGGQVTVWRDMKTYRDRAYAVSDNTSEGLMVFDMSQLPDTVIKTYHSNEFFNKSHNIFIDELNGRLYAAGTNTANMVVLDIATNPDQPTLLASVSLPGGEYVHDVYVRDHIAYCSHGYNGFYVWDFANPTAPVRKAHVITGGYNHSSWVTDNGQYAIYAEEVPIGMPLGMIDLSDVANGEIEIVNTFKFPLLAPADENNRPHNPFIRGRYAIVSYYHDGLQIIDINDPLDPTLKAYYDTHDNTAYSGYAGAWGTYPFLGSGNLLVSDMARGLFVLRADSLSLAPVEVDSDPDVSIELLGLNPFCEGSSTTLAIADGAKAYQWYKDGQAISGATGNELEVNEIGQYWVVASNGRCENTSEMMDISSTPLPDLSQLPTGNFDLCDGLEMLIEAPDTFDFYIWKKDGTVLPEDGNSLVIGESGLYTLTAFLNGCSSVSDDIIITVNELPDVSFSLSDTVFCQGTPVVLEVPQGADSYEWFRDGASLNQFGHSIETDVSGLYHVIATSQNCENQSSEMELTFNEPVVPVISANGNELSSTAALSYQWYLAGTLIPGAVQPSYQATESGLYQVTTIDDNGCQASSEEFELIITGAESIENTGVWSISPNPAKDELQFSIELERPASLELHLLDVSGREVLTWPALTARQVEQRLPISGLSSGLYFVKLKVDEKVVITKLVKE